MISSYLVRSIRSKMTLDMLEFLEKNERLEDEKIFAEIESMVDKIIVIDNDYQESPSMCVYTTVRSTKAS